MIEWSVTHLIFRAEDEGRLKTGEAKELLRDLHRIRQLPTLQLHRR